MGLARSDPSDLQRCPLPSRTAPAPASNNHTLLLSGPDVHPVSHGPGACPMPSAHPPSYVPPHPLTPSASAPRPTQAYALEFAKRGAAVVVNDLGGGMKGEGERFDLSTALSFGSPHCAAPRRSLATLLHVAQPRASLGRSLALGEALDRTRIAPLDHISGQWGLAPVSGWVVGPQGCGQGCGTRRLAATCPPSPLGFNTGCTARLHCARSHPLLTQGRNRASGSPMLSSMRSRRWVAALLCVPPCRTIACQPF
jgi:hypothetical protein